MKAIDINEQLLIFRVGPVACCVSARDVDSIVDAQALHQLPQQANFIAGVLQYRDSTVSIVNVFQKFALPTPERVTHGRFIMAYTRHGVTGFWVDEIIEITNDFEQDWLSPPAFVEDKVFDKTLLWHDRLILKTDFDRLFSMKNATALSQWANNNTQDWNIKTAAASPQLDGQQIGHATAESSSSELAIEDLVTRGTALSQPMSNTFPLFADDEHASDVAHDEALCAPDSVMQEHEVDLENVFDFGAKNENGNYPVDNAHLNTRSHTDKAADEKATEAQAESGFQLVSQDGHDLPGMLVTDEDEVSLNSARIVDENQRDLMFLPVSEKADRKPHIGNDIEPHYMASADGPDIDDALNDLPLRIENKNHLLIDLPLSDSLTDNDLDDHQVETKPQVNDKTFAAFSEIPVDDENISLDFIHEDDDPLGLDDELDIVLTDLTEKAEQPDMTQSALFERNVAGFFEEKLASKVAVYQHSIESQNHNRIKSSNQAENVSAEDRLLSRFAVSDIVESPTEDTDIQLVTLSEIRDETEELDDSVFDLNQRESAPQCNAENFEKIGSDIFLEFENAASDDIRKDEAIIKVLNRIEGKSSKKAKRSPFRLVASIIFVASGVFMAEHYGVMQRFSDVDIPRLVLLSEITQASENPDVERFLFNIETVSEKFGRELSVRNVSNKLVPKQSSLQLQNEAFSLNKENSEKMIAPEKVSGVDFETSEIRLSDQNATLKVISQAGLQTQAQQNSQNPEIITDAMPLMPHIGLSEAAGFSPVFRIHNIVRGDTLWAIAGTYLNNPFRYPELAKWSKIKNPDLIYPGNKVRYLPPKSSAEIIAK